MNDREESLWLRLYAWQMQMKSSSVALTPQMLEVDATESRQEE